MIEQQPDGHGFESSGEILVVDDTPESRLLIGALLTEAGYRVCEAEDGARALAVLAGISPDLILLDVQMPGMDGFEVCRRLKCDAGTRDIPVIFLSATHDTEAQVRGLRLGAVDFVGKPFQPEEVLARVHTQMRLARVTRALAAERAHLENRVHERTAELAAEVEVRRAAEERLRLAGMVIQSSHDAITITDSSARIVAVNPAFTRMTGYAEDEALGQEASLLKSGQHDSAFYEQLWRALTTDGYWSGELWNRRKDGSLYPELATISAVRDARELHYVQVAMDISERKDAQRTIDFLANHDPLTRLPNRALLRDRFEQAAALVDRDGGVLALISLDLDRFQMVTDSLGHPFGDRVLQVVAAMLLERVGDGGTVSRQGGDEFIVLLADEADMGTVQSCLNRIIEGLRGGLDVDGRTILLTTSIGIALYPHDGSSFDDLLRNADTALFRAKGAGRDGYSFYTEQMNAEVREWLTLDTQLRGAVARGELEVHYQPKVSLASGRIVGAEALLRWNCAELGAVSPARFIPLAEETGQIVPIGEWLFTTVCRQINAWRRAGLPVVRIAVNLSCRQFEQVELCDYVRYLLREHDLLAENLEVEITESAVMQDPVAAERTLRELRRLGIAVALDDFGTGYSSLAYLKRFPVDKLKIDKSFIDDVTRVYSDAAMTRSIVALAHDLGMRVIAEGVETREQYEFLRKCQCDEVQGYFCSRPLAAAQFAALLGADGSAPSFQSS